MAELRELSRPAGNLLEETISTYPERRRPELAG